MRKDQKQLLSIVDRPFSFVATLHLHGGGVAAHGVGVGDRSTDADEHFS